MPLTGTGFRPALETALKESLSFLDALGHSSVAATVDIDTLRRRFDMPLPAAGATAEQVVRDLARDVEGGLIGSAGGRFFAWVIGGSLPAALAADWLTATWDQNAGMVACGPAAALVEETAGAWLKDVLGLPATASFAFVSGCQMAHTTCLAAARHALLARRNWNVEEQGLYGAPPIRFLTSDQRHGTIQRTLRLLGLGRGHLVDLPCDEAGRLLPSTLRDALAADPAAPTIVLMQAGDLNIGAYDSFQELIPIAHEFDAWVHVDGAFGLWAAASPRLRHLVRGVEQADSWATDGHKWLNVPYDCGYAFVADAGSHRAAMSQRESYLSHATEARDALDWTPEWSRRARGFPTYAALCQLGRDGVVELVERCCRHAHALVMGMGALPGAEVLWEPVINQGLVRFLDPAASSAADHDAFTDQAIAAILHTGEAFFSPTTWRGKRAMRVSVCNWQTSEEDVARSVAAVASVLKGR